MLLGDPVLYWAFRIVTLLSLLISGYFVTYKDNSGKNYWKFCLPTIVIYSLNYGLRWDRLFDYAHYYQDLTGPLYADYDEFVYVWWTELFKMSHLPFWVGFVFYSALLIFGYMLIVKHFPKTAIWSFPLFLIIPDNVDNFTRQYFATAIIFIGIAMLYDKRYKSAILLGLIGSCIHFSAFFLTIPFYTLFFFQGRYLKKRRSVKTFIYISIILFALIYFFWDQKYFQGFADYLGSLSGGESRYQSYLDNSDTWFTEEGDINLKRGQVLNVNAAGQFLRIISLVIIIIYGAKAILKEPKLKVIYLGSLISIFIRQLSGAIEIYNRFATLYICFLPIMIGAIFAYVKLSKPMKILLFTVFVLTYYFLGFFWRISDIAPMGYQFIWDR